MLNQRKGNNYWVRFSRYLRTRPILSRIMTLKQISRVEMAAMVGLISVLMPSHNFLGSVVILGLLMKIAIINSSNEIKKAKRPEEIMPGRAIGKTIFLRAVSRPAPRFMAACSISMGTPRKEALMTTTTNGVAMTVCAIINPPKVPFSPNFAKRI